MKLLKMNKIKKQKYIQKKIKEKWDVISSEKYPTYPKELIYVENWLPNITLNFYKKEDILFFYYKFAFMKFKHIYLTFPLSINIIFKDVFNKIEEIILENNYHGKIGFECCELEQLNKFVEFQLFKNNYKFIKDGNYILVENYIKKRKIILEKKESNLLINALNV